MKIDFTQAELKTMSLHYKSFIPELETALKEFEKTCKLSKKAKLAKDSPINGLKVRITILKQLQAKTELALSQFVEVDTSTAPEPSGEDRVHQLATDAIKLIDKPRINVFSVISTAHPETLEGFEDLKKIVGMAYRRGYAFAQRDSHEQEEPAQING